MPAISSKISHVAGFRLAALASTQPHAVVNTNLQKRFYTTQYKMGKLPEPPEIIKKLIKNDDITSVLNAVILYWFSVNWTNPLYCLRLLLPLANTETAFGGLFLLGFFKALQSSELSWRIVKWDGNKLPPQRQFVALSRLSLAGCTSTEPASV